MGKSYLMQIFNSIYKMIFILLMSIGASYLIEIVYLEFKDSPLQILKASALFLEFVVGILNLISITVLFFIIVILIPEIYLRLKYDAIKNLFKSIIGTLRFRRFTLKVDNSTSIEKKSTATLKYNRALKKSILDVSQDGLLLYIRLPRNIESQLIFDEYETKIREHVSNYYKEYTISNFERERRNIWLAGTRK